METYIYIIIGIVIFLTLVFALKKYFNGGVNKYYPSLKDQVIVITGANTGIGYIAAMKMAKLKPRMIILACRDEGRGKEAERKINAETGQQNVKFMQMDLNDLDSVKAFTDKFNGEYDRLDILLNNAGIMALPIRDVTVQGYEKQFGVNHVGHFLLTMELMTKLKATEKSRIVNVSSLAHSMGSNKINFDDLQNEKSYAENGWEAYSKSKLSNVYFTREHANVLLQEGISNVKVCSLHPGIVRTELGRYMYEGRACYKCTFQVIFAPLFYLFTKSPWAGTQTSLLCCLIDWDKLETGKYYSDCAVKQEKFTPEWEKEAKQLWEWSTNAVQQYRSS